MRSSRTSKWSEHQNMHATRSDNGNKAKAARGTVVDVSLCGDDPSTPSRPKLSSQSHMVRRRDIHSIDEHGSDNGNEAQAAGACVVDVSLCGDGPSTRSQPRLSSQNHMSRRRENESLDLDEVVCTNMWSLMFNVIMATRPRLLELVSLTCLSAETTPRLARSQSQVGVLVLKNKELRMQGGEHDDPSSFIPN